MKSARYCFEAARARRGSRQLALARLPTMWAGGVVAGGGVVRATWSGEIPPDDLDELMRWTWSVAVDGELVLGIHDSVLTAFLIGADVNRATFERRAGHSSLASALDSAWVALTRSAVGG